MQDYLRESARPTTPSKPRLPIHGLNTNHPPPETFFDDATPIEHAAPADGCHDPLRDSHDLSFAEGAAIRASVVDNMLLSLDQFAPYAQDDFFLRDASFRPPGTRRRGHTYTSSQSSDYDIAPRETTPRFALHHSRARRSNSSNSMAAAAMVFGRKGSAPCGQSSSQQQQQQQQQQQSGHMRGSGRKGSKSSGSSSMDFGQSGILGNQRLGFGKRSASFDHGGLGERSRNASVKVESVLDRGRMAYQNYPDDYDAAPEPTIPAGPRRIAQDQTQSPPVLAATSSFVLPPQPPGRRNSIRSNTSYRTLRKGKSQVEPSMRAQAQEFVNASTLRDLPVVPAFQDPPAPSPTVSTRKPLFPPHAPAATPQQKPGFFRRVFGGGPKASPQQPHAPSSANLAQWDSPEASVEQHQQQQQQQQQQQRAAPEADTVLSQARPRTTPSNTSHIAAQLKSLPKAPQTASSSREAPLPPPSLAKKPSSFFRRRKKSVSENVPPPVMALDFTAPSKPVLPGQPSPGVSSLHQVMNPYLSRDTREQPPAPEAPRDEPSRGFSPGYKPHKDATVRTVDMHPLVKDETRPSSRADQVYTSSQPATAGSPRRETKTKPKPYHVLRDASQQDDTFLADSSSCNEDAGHRQPPVDERSGLTNARKPNPGPTPKEFGSEARGGGAHSEPLTELDPVFSGSGILSQSASEAADQGSWALAQQENTTPTTNRKPSAGSKRVWLDTTLPERTSGNINSDLKLPLEGPRSSQHSLDKPSSSPDRISPTSPNDVFHSATSLPIVQVESRDSDTMPSVAEDRSMHIEPTDSDRERALQIYSGNDSAALKAEAAAMLGDVTLTSLRIRRAFMDLFDWTGFTILAAMRDLCGKIVLKAETQQVDRILMSLSERWCECNSSHGFKAVDVVHTICYSILLLNTDLHMADIESRMTRSQFVKNTLPTVTRVCKDAVQAEGGETLRPQSTHFRRPSLPWNDKAEPVSPGAESIAFSADMVDEPAETKRARSRLSIRPPARSGSDGILSFDSVTGESNTLVNTPWHGPMRGWEIQIEVVLKEFYESIRKQRLPLHGASNATVHHQPSNNNLSVSNMLRRTPSVLSKAPSDNTSYRSRAQGDFRSVGSRWATKNRSKQKLYPSSTVASSRTSLDDGSVWSPAGSSTWSRYSYGKTGMSMSMDTLGSHFAPGDYQQAIGFANALSQAIIREEGMTIASDEEFSRVAPLLEDETLELVGAPWAKEGILKHKHHLESSDKKAKDRAWSECFAVVEKGYMRLFSFNMNSKSVRNKSKVRPSAGGVVGGGNWMDNAEALESFPLRQTIASALPPPGYSKSRPYVFALSLPTGAVHLFQVGTPDIAREFVCTANYWSARLSKEPLMGGVSSMEYGWGETVINPALIRNDSTPSVKGHMPRPSVTSSLRSSMDHATGTPKARLAGDKVALSDWSPPTSSMMASNLMEVDQLRALTDYVKNIESDLAHHNELRAPLLIAFSPRHPNAARAMANWERKSQYLLREIVKFRTYIDTLTMAQTQKQKIYAEREARGEELAKAEEDAAESQKRTGEDGAKEAPYASEPTSHITPLTTNPSLPQGVLLHP